MSEILSAIFLAVITGICLAAFFSVMNALFPARTERTRHSAEASPVRAFFLGLVNFLFFGALSLAFVALGDNLHRIFFIPAILILILISIGLSFGLGGVVQLTGNRLFPDRSPLQRTTWGTAVLFFACLTPFVGWFGMTVYIGWLGMGAFLLSFFKQKGNSTEE